MKETRSIVGGKSGCRVRGLLVPDNSSPRLSAIPGKLAERRAAAPAEWRRICTA